MDSDDFTLSCLSGKIAVQNFQLKLKIIIIEKEVENVRTQADSASQSRIRRIQEKMQSEIDLAEDNEKEALKKYTNAKAKSNTLAEELIGEKHKSNLLAGELNEKDQRLGKLMSERYGSSVFFLIVTIFDVEKQYVFIRERVSDVIREEFADRIVKAEKDLERTKSEMAESEARHRNEYNELKRFVYVFYH